MLNLKNFQVTQPDEILKSHLSGPLMNALFLQSEGGVDWYAVQSRFQTNTVKIAYDAAGVIRQIVDKPDADGNYDVSLLVPINLSVAEIAVNYLPDGTDINGSWVFDGVSVYQDSAIVSDLLYQRNLQRRDSLLTKCAAYAFAVQPGAAFSNTHSGISEVLQQYADALLNVDLTLAKPDWPEVPAFLTR